MMNVCFCTRTDWKERPGGDLVQARKTALELEKLGVNVSFAASPDEIPGDVDLLHLFNLTRVSDSLSFSDFSIRKNIPYVISPIWHSLGSMSDFYSLLYKNIPCFNIAAYLALKEPIYYRSNIWVLLRSVFFWKWAVRNVVKKSKLLLPNSPQELNCLFSDLNISGVNYHIVPNGVDDAVKLSLEGSKSKIITVPGRVEPRKNQLSIIAAFQNSDAFKKGYKLNFIGKMADHHSDYTNKFMKMVSENESVSYLGEVSYDEVQNWFNKSELVILASFFETTGLVVLEGLMNGCNAVMTECSYNDYYYADKVDYCNPYSIKSISEAIDSSIERASAFDTDFFSKFRWSNSATETLSAYRSALSS